MHPWRHWLPRSSWRSEPRTTRRRRGSATSYGLQRLSGPWPPSYGGSVGECSKNWRRLSSGASRTRIPACRLGSRPLPLSRSSPPPHRHPQRPRMRCTASCARHRPSVRRASRPRPQWRASGTVRRRRSGVAGTVRATRSSTSQSSVEWRSWRRRGSMRPLLSSPNSSRRLLCSWKLGTRGPQRSIWQTNTTAPSRIAPESSS
mmetsp:Transcript_7205/g.17981  ORF Transcript_7205/g.17981 Transcript_7205/m.17981 type:complete len:203 (+) Transcript_7205:129-737(+)